MSNSTSTTNTISISTNWSKEEEKAFENAIAMHWTFTEQEEKEEEQWETIASLVPSKSIEELKLHYQMLVDDVAAIEAGQIPIPNYSAEESTGQRLTNSSNNKVNASSSSSSHHIGSERRASSSSHGNGFSGRNSEQDRKKGIPWTEEEHRLFLLGLDKFGKGDWRSISRNYVISRTPTQVASHAQKYFIRLNSVNRERRRSSIHDITSLTNNGGGNGGGGSQVSPHQAGPAPVITGHQHQHQANGNPPCVPLPGPVPGMGMYGGAPMGHPVAATVGPHGRGHLGSAVGTPVMLPQGHHHHHHHPPYVLPLPYPMAPPTMHQ